MTVPAVPNLTLEHLERGALPFRAFPLPLGGNVGNAFLPLSRKRVTLSSVLPNLSKVKRNA